jgi:diaminopimelate decarboxylase
MTDISKNNCAVAMTTVERDTLSTPFDTYRETTARDNLKQIKDGFERQVFAVKVNSTS